MEFGQTKNFAKLIYLISRFFSPGLFKFSGILCICLFTNAFLFSVNKIRPGLPKHNMSTFVRSSTSRSSLKHRLFAPNPDENEMDDEEDDDEFEQYVKKNEIKERINQDRISGCDIEISYIYYRTINTYQMIRILKLLFFR